MMSYCTSGDVAGNSGSHITLFPSSVNSPNSDQLHIRAVYLRLSLASTAGHAPRLLKLVYVPLEESDTAFRPLVVPLHRVWNPELVSSEDAVYASTDPVTATGYGDSAGIRFQAYLEEEIAAEGVIQKNGEGQWGMECRLAAGIVEVRAVGEGVDLRSTSRWSPRPRGRQRRKSRFVTKLQRIPEEVEGISQTTIVEGKDCHGDRWATSKGGCGGGDQCLTGQYWDSDQDGPWKTGSSQELRWAVDMGVWAVCVGVGLLLSRAAASSIRKGFFLL